eukprot:XP_015579179.1 reticulon-like protein B5 [Ricinus communis]
MVEEPADAFNPELVNEIKARDTEHDHKHSSSSSSSSSSDSEIDNYVAVQSAQKNRLFGRQKPLHLVLGGGKPADIILWRNKQASGCVFAVATVLWLLFECAGYTLLTFLCHSLILSFATLFLWSNLATFLNISFHFQVIAVLWVISVVGSWFSFLTLFYLVFVMLLTMPMLYEKNEDDVDTYAEKAWIEIKKQYAVLDEKVIQKIPVIISQKDHKQQ